MKIKVTRTITEEIDIAYLSIEVPYDDDDEIPEYIHEGRPTLKFLIDLDRRKVVDWPEGNHFDLFLKVRDSGTYRLLDPHMGELACIDQDYVPRGVTCEDGDYVELCIESDGTVTNLPRKYDFSDFFKGME